MLVGNQLTKGEEENKQIDGVEWVWLWVYFDHKTELWPILQNTSGCEGGGWCLYIGGDQKEVDNLLRWEKNSTTDTNIENKSTT